MNYFAYQIISSFKNHSRYYGSANSEKYACIAQELCVGSLENYVVDKKEFDELRERISYLEVMKKTVVGITYIHRISIKGKNISKSYQQKDKIIK